MTDWQIKNRNKSILDSKSPILNYNPNNGHFKKSALFGFFVSNGRKPVYNHLGDINGGNENEQNHI